MEDTPAPVESIELNEDDKKKAKKLTKKDKGIDKRTKENYVITPARQKAIEAMRAGRARVLKEKEDIKNKKEEIKIAKKIKEKTEKEKVNKEYTQLVEPEPEPEPQIKYIKKSKSKPKPKKKIVYVESESDDSSEEEVRYVKKRSKKKYVSSNRNYEELDNEFDNMYNNLKNNIQKNKTKPKLEPEPEPNIPDIPDKISKYELCSKLGFL